MLRPWSASLTPSLAVLSLALGCSSAEPGLNESSGSSGSAESTSLTGTSEPEQTDSGTLPTTSTSDPTTLTTGDSPATTETSGSSLSSTSDSDTDTDPSTSTDGTSTGDTTTDTGTGDTSTGDTSTGTTDGSSSSSTGEPPEGCSDGEKNGDETDIDCGGSCDGCDIDQTCGADADCLSQSCEANFCIEASCDDSKLNGDETDVDCGGSCDADCLDGDSCAIGEDCESGVCAGDICQPAACNDDVLNGDETDVDCGGTCDGCAVGDICLVDDDCVDGICTNDVCAGGSCDDGIANGGEAGIDCGGPTCAPCELVINEVDYDQINADNAEFVEIFNKEAGPVSLADFNLVLVNGSDNKTYRVVDLAGAGSIAAGQYLLVAPANFVAPNGVLKVAFPMAADQIQNGMPDGIALIDKTHKKLVDALSYEGSVTMGTVTGLNGTTSLVEGMALAANVADSNTVVGSLARIPDGTDTNNAATDWKFTTTLTPGVANVP